MEHLIELRSRLIKAVIAFAVMFALCFFFAKTIYNILVWPFVLVAGPENSKFIYTALLEYFITQLKLAMFGAAFSGVSGDRRADLHVRRARPLPQRAPRLPAVSRGDAVLLRARRGDGLFPGDAAAGALLARHAAGARRRAGGDRAVAEGRRISLADDGAGASPSASPSSFPSFSRCSGESASSPRRNCAASGAISSSAPSSSPPC